jgi:hypothetical protein
MERYLIVDVNTQHAALLFASSPMEALRMSNIPPSTGAVYARQRGEGRGSDWIPALVPPVGPAIEDSESIQTRTP